MTTMVRVQSRAWIAMLAGVVLVLQAILTSVTPPGAAVAAAVERVAAFALCIGSPAGRNDADSPAPPHPAHQACCILCSVPGLAATGGVPDLAAPAWGPPLASPLRQQTEAPLARLAERYPVRARAPPRA